MSFLPCALIVTNAAKAGCEFVLTAYRGENLEFGRPLIPADTVNPTPQTQPTHWLMFDASTDQSDVIVYNGFADGDLPPLANPTAQWGENGLISAVDAMSAINGANLQVYSVSGDVEPTEFVEGLDGHGGILASRGLRYRPTEEF